MVLQSVAVSKKGEVENSMPFPGRLMGNSLMTTFCRTQSLLQDSEVDVQWPATTMDSLLIVPCSRKEHSILPRHGSNTIESCLHGFCGSMQGHRPSSTTLARPSSTPLKVFWKFLALWYFNEKCSFYLHLA